jgi:hypothetical protein
VGKTLTWKTLVMALSGPGTLTDPETLVRLYPEALPLLPALAAAGALQQRQQLPGSRCASSSPWHLLPACVGSAAVQQGEGGEESLAADWMCTMLEVRRAL